MKNLFYTLLILGLVFSSCKKDEDNSGNTGGTTPCSSDKVIDRTRGACDQSLTWSSNYSERTNTANRIITANSIPDHKVGLFGGGQGSLNPNAIREQMEEYTMPLNPTLTGNLQALLGTTAPATGPQYSFGILFNGVELDPIAAEPFPHTNIMDPNVNWEWNLEALNVNLGLDCNSAHVQPTGKYHYHGTPTLYLDGLNIQSNTMTLIGYAADGFPIYYKYAYDNPNDANSGVREMKVSYVLKSGSRPGDGVTAPCGTYDGVYSNDYEYKANSGDLDEANGRTGVTPEFPSGTFYYVVTDEFPAIPRYFRGTPSDDFRIGQ